MIDVIIGGSIAVGFIYSVANYKAKEVRKIDDVFRNINYRVGKMSPRLIETRKHDNYSEYIYEVPSGLIDDPKLRPILSKTLRKPVTVSFNGVLIVKIYNNGLPSVVNYDWNPTSDWTIPIGNTIVGTFVHDFDKVPHMTIAGATRQGKTVLLKLILAHLINSHPNNVEFYIIDLKGGLEFGRYGKLPQVKTVASDVQGAHTSLQTLLKRLKDDLSRYRQNGYTNVFEAKERRRIFIITDEGAELTPSTHHSKKEKAMYSFCQRALSEICRIGGALGYRNIFCTQYPTSDTLPRQVKQNSDARISFRLPTEVASRVAIDEGGAELLSNVGRAIYRTHERHEVQVNYVSDVDIVTRFKRYEVDSREEVTQYAGEVEEEDTTPRTDIIDIGGFDIRN